jgi:Tetratricopeptide repeat.
LAFSLRPGYADHDNLSAIKYFGEAVALDPKFALAWAWLARENALGYGHRSLDHFRNALQLDPRNASLVELQAETLATLRQYEAALKAYDQLLDIIPGNSTATANKARILQDEGDLSAAAATLSSQHPDPYSNVFDAQIDQWVYERRYTEAIAALKTALASAVPLPRPVIKIYTKTDLARLEQLSGDIGSARAAFQQVQNDLEALYRSDPENWEMTWRLAWISAALGDIPKALALARRLVEMWPISRDAFVGTWAHERLAIILAQAGEKDLALKELAISAQNPVGIRYGNLKFDPFWDPLRGDARFEKIVTSLAPKEVK